jgi:hypothetical protein
MIDLSDNPGIECAQFMEAVSLFPNLDTLMMNNCITDSKPVDFNLPSNLKRLGLSNSANGASLAKVIAARKNTLQWLDLSYSHVENSGI